MASINVLMSLQDYVTTPMKGIGKETTEVEKKMKKAQNALKSVGNSANKAFLSGVKSAAQFALGLTGITTALSLVGIKEFADKTMELADKQELAETQLEAVLKNVTSIQDRGGNAVKDATDSLKSYASELQNTGIIGDEVTLAGMAQLATFQMNDDQIKEVSGSMLDLLAKTKGYNATQEDAVNIANMIGKAYTGNAGALARVGITMSDAEKEAIKNGDANERAAMIAQVLKNNVGGVNKAMAATATGKQTQAMNAYGDMLEEIGKKIIPIKSALWQAFGSIIPVLHAGLMPILDDIGKGFQAVLPDIQKFAKEFAQNLPKYLEMGRQGLHKVVETAKSLWKALKLLSPVIVGVVAGFTAFNIMTAVASGLKALTTAIGLCRHATLLFNLVLKMNPLFLVAAAIAIVIVILVALYQHWDQIKKIVGEVWESVKSACSKMYDAVVDFVDSGINAFNNFIQWLHDTFVNGWNDAMQKLSDFATGIWDTVSGAAHRALDWIVDKVDSIRNAFSSIHFPSVVDDGLAGHALGTSYFSGGFTRVNEHGGEVMKLPNGTQIIPHDVSVKAAGRHSPVTVNLTILGNVLGNQEFCNEIGNMIFSQVQAAIENM